MPNSAVRPLAALVTLVAAIMLSACTVAPPIVAATHDVRRGTASSSAADTSTPTAEDAREVARLVRDYLRVRPAGRAPNPYWRRDEQARFSNFDVAGMWTYGTRSFRQRY